MTIDTIACTTHSVKINRPPIATLFTHRMRTAWPRDRQGATSLHNKHPYGAPQCVHQPHFSNPHPSTPLPVLPLLHVGSPSPHLVSFGYICVCFSCFVVHLHGVALLFLKTPPSFLFCLPYTLRLGNTLPIKATRRAQWVSRRLLPLPLVGHAMRTVLQRFRALLSFVAICAASVAQRRHAGHQ